MRVVALPCSFEMVECSHCCFLKKQNKTKKNYFQRIRIITTILVVHVYNLSVLGQRQKEEDVKARSPQDT